MSLLKFSSPLPSSGDESFLKSELLKIFRPILNVKKDGNCLPRSLALGMTPEEVALLKLKGTNDYMGLRLAVSHHAQKNRHLLSGFLVVDEALDDEDSAFFKAIAEFEAGTQPPLRRHFFQENMMFL